MQKQRGVLLSIFGILFAVAAVQDILKPFHLEGAKTGLVFLGTRLEGTLNVVMSVVLAAFLAFYAIGIWRMRQYALVLSFVYALHVLINVVVFPMKYAGENNGSPAFLIGFVIGAIVIPWGAVITLWRRRADLT